MQHIGIHIYDWKFRPPVEIKWIITLELLLHTCVSVCPRWPFLLLYPLIQITAFICLSLTILLSVRLSLSLSLFSFARTHTHTHTEVLVSKTFEVNIISDTRLSQSNSVTLKMFPNSHSKNNIRYGISLFVNAFDQKHKSKKDNIFVKK